MEKSFTQLVREEISTAAKMGRNQADRNRAFVRECFAASGVISNPSRTYHLEFTLDAQNAHKLTEILTFFGLRPKMIARGGQSVVYLKEAEAIADVLKIMRANKALLALEEMRVEKDIRGNVNRAVNCETANLGKTIDAAQNQIEAIKFISEKVGLDSLSPPLAEVAGLRLTHENASLAEIGEMLSSPISKSGVNHRLRKICKIAEKSGFQRNL